MPERFSTRLGYESWLRNHILPRCGGSAVTAMQARPVELWLNTLPVSPKSRVHIRALIRAVWDYAMWRADIPTQRNPMELVSIKNATKRRRKPRSLTVEEFQRLLREFQEPVRTMALVCVCFGLRISECPALKWTDVDWGDAKLEVARAIVRQGVGDVKTEYSGRLMSIDTGNAGSVQVLAPAHAVCRRGRLGVCESSQSGAIAFFVSLGVADVPEGWRPRRHRETRNALTTSQLPFLAGRGGKSDCCPAETHATFRYPYDAQHLW